jgi:hypothetical protein
MARDGFDGLGKMRKGEKPAYEPKPKEGTEPRPEQERSGGEKTHTWTEHGDGTHTTRMHDGSEEHHENHLAAMAHMGHHVTGGDRHHVVHHDGMAAHSHSIDEQGQHMDHGEHNSADEAKQALDQFLGEEAQEPAHQHEEENEGEGPVMGGM